MKKSFAFFLAALMLVSSLASCASEPADPTPSADTTASSAGAEDTTAAETKNPNEDDLPERNFEGEKITFLVRTEMGYEFDAENDGEVVNDAVFNRNVDLGERFNVKFEYIQQKGLWASRSTYTDSITGPILAGDAPYNILTGQSNIILPLAVQNLYHDLADAEHIDFSKPYWKEGYHSNATLNGHLFTLMGDYALSTLNNSNVMIFNKTMFDNNKVEHPYQLVKDGKWTVDKFIEISSQFVKDVNGDGAMTNADQYGLAANNNGVTPFCYSTGCTMFDPDESGSMKFNFPSEQEANVFDKMFDFYNGGVFVNSDSMLTEYTGSKMATFFATDHSAFCAGRLMEVEYLRDMESDFGILPYPKYDEDQKEYITSVLRTVTVASIPTTYAKPEKLTFILEAMSSYGYNKITPAYYEVALKGKYTRDSLTAEMLDIITTTQYFAFADVFYAELGGQSDFLVLYLKEGVKGLGSFVEGRRSALQADLEALLKAYAK